MRMGLPKITPVVKWLLIANVGMFLFDIIFFGGGQNPITPLDRLLAVYPTLGQIPQIWRYVTYQFLHGDIMHILFNMLGLFFLGPTLERHWGGKKFLAFYIGCGVAGGLCYPILVHIGLINSFRPLVGASGAILGMLAACAIMFPHFIVFILFFPVPIRVAAIICIFLATAIILSRGANAGGEAAHLGGMAAGAVYVFSQAWRAKMKLKMRSGKWEKKVSQQRELRMELDRILQKVHDFGIQSLTRREKSILKKATEAERMRNQT